MKSTLQGSLCRTQRGSAWGSPAPNCPPAWSLNSQFPGRLTRPSPCSCPPLDFSSQHLPQTPSHRPFCPCPPPTLALTALPQLISLPLGLCLSVTSSRKPPGFTMPAHDPHPFVREYSLVCHFFVLFLLFPSRPLDNEPREEVQDPSCAPPWPAPGPALGTD